MAKAEKPNTPSATSPTARMVERLRLQYEAGDHSALLEALDFCARAGMTPPLWLAEAYCKAYENWTTYRAKTLDEAFGVSRKKGMHIERAALRKRLKARVVLEVLRLEREQNLPIDQDMFTLVGKKLKIKGGLANKIYYEDNPWRELLPHFQLLRNSKNS